MQEQIDDSNVFFSFSNQKGKKAPQMQHQERIFRVQF